MSDAPTLKSLFYHDPTRPLEEVQKVNATAQAERDVEEFHETESARRVLEALSSTITQDARLLDPRFLYLHATFGSGKTHLLKLIGYATGHAGIPESVVNDLSTRFDGFRELRNAMEESTVDHFVPVFLNLLNRDAAQEPSIPILIYEGIGARLGYPTDPRWLTEFLLQLERKAPQADLWSRLQKFRVEGRGLLDDRGEIWPWLYEAVPQVLDRIDIACSRDDVREWILGAKENVSPGTFDANALRKRVEAVQGLLTTRIGASTELLIGLDEIALFIGDRQSRYEELRNTMHALFDGPNPVVLGTGQWALKDVHRDFVGDPDPDAWYSREGKLEGADTEVIVRKRWLQKSGDAKPRIENALESAPDPPGELKNGTTSDRDAVAAYPFRSGDLRRIREAMQKLLTRDRFTATEHIQGRALLVLVRSLFVRQHWADEKRLGVLVPWSEVYELLRTETNLIPTWTEELLSRLRPIAEERESPVLEVARTVFLVNHIRSVPATEAVITHLLLGHVEEDEETLRSSIREALYVLRKKNYVFEEAKEEPVRYRLLTEEEVTLAEKIEERADTISYPRLRSVLLDWMKTYSPLLATEGNRREVQIGGERGVPLTLFYSVLQSVPEPSDHADTVALRVLATPGETDDPVSEWVDHNQRSSTLEDALVVVELSANFEGQLRRYVATGDVLRNETRRFRELQSDNAREERDLREQVRTALDEATVRDSQTNQQRGTFAEGLETFVVESVVPRKFPKRRTLAQPLQPIDDAPKLAAFFRGDEEWPLAEEDAAVLGVDLDTRELEKDHSWPQEFGQQAEKLSSGKVLTGEQIIGMIESRQGAFLGTPVEAMAALLLVLATKPTLQLRRDGELLRDHVEKGRAVRTKTEIQRLTVRLEAPTGQDKVERLQSLHRTLVGNGTTPSEAPELVRELCAWSQEHGGQVQQVHRFVEQTFDAVSIGTLADRLQTASADPSSVDANVLSEPDLLDEAKAFQRARRFVLGDASDRWDRFIQERRDLRNTDRWEQITRDLEKETAGEEVPTPGRIEHLLDRVDQFREEKKSEVKDSGTDDGEADDDEDASSASPFDDFFDRFDLEDEEETKERLRGLVQRLHDEAQGRIVVIRDENGG